MCFCVWGNCCITWFTVDSRCALSVVRVAHCETDQGPVLLYFYKAGKMLFCVAGRKWLRVYAYVATWRSCACVCGYVCGGSCRCDIEGVERQWGGAGWQGWKHPCMWICRVLCVLFKPAQHACRPGHSVLFTVIGLVSQTNDLLGKNSSHKFPSLWQHWVYATFAALIQHIY